MGRVKDAIEILKRRCTIAASEWPASDTLRRHSQDLSVASQLYEHCLQYLPTPHAQRLATYTSLSAVKLLLGDLIAAEENACQAIQLVKVAQEGTYSHSEIAISYNNLAQVKTAMREPEEAARLRAKALEFAREAGSLKLEFMILEAEEESNEEEVRDNA